LKPPFRSFLQEARRLAVKFLGITVKLQSGDGGNIRVVVNGLIRM
jgi:hypothetical protein